MRRANGWLMLAAAWTILLLSPAAAGQVLLDMPPPPAKAVSAEPEAMPSEGQDDVGEVALARYRDARVGAHDTYWQGPPSVYHRSYYGPIYSWSSCYGYPYCGHHGLWSGFAWPWATVTIQCSGSGSDGKSDG
jgi:hypothetical protein